MLRVGSRGLVQLCRGVCERGGGGRVRFQREANKMIWCVHFNGSLTKRDPCWEGVRENQGLKNFKKTPPPHHQDKTFS